MSEVRLQKAIADRGVASRRRAEELIVQGRVRVSGEVVRELGTKVAPDARIEIDGRAVGAVGHRYVALNKPAGVVSSARGERGRRSVVDLVSARERLYPVGRLDVDSEGLILLTNDGDWAEHVLHPRYQHEREYEVEVEGEAARAVPRLRAGVRLEEGLARADRVRAIGAERLRIVIHTGWKRQVRRMCALAGLRVRRLVRVRIGAVTLGRLRPGQWRELSAREVKGMGSSDERVPREKRVHRQRSASRERGRRPSRRLLS